MARPDVTLRRGDLIAGLRAGRIVVGRNSGTGAAPLFLDEAEARWLHTAAIPALVGSPPAARHVITDPAVTVELDTPDPDPAAAPPAPDLLRTLTPAPALF